jgi:hypothetical protein
MTTFSWMLDSPKSHTDGDQATRLYALADLIEPFALRLPNLRPRFNPRICIFYRFTPEHSRGINGGSDSFFMPAELMRRFGAWDLNVSYESFWFDATDQTRSRQPVWWRKVVDSMRRGRKPRPVGADQLPTEEQRKQLCGLMHSVFNELRYLNGEQAHDLAYAFHNLPMEIYGWGTWNVSWTRGRLLRYQGKHGQNLGVDYVALFDKIFQEKLEVHR